MNVDYYRYDESGSDEEANAPTVSKERVAFKVQNGMKDAEEERAKLTEGRELDRQRKAGGS